MRLYPGLTRVLALSGIAQAAHTPSVLQANTTQLRTHGPTPHLLYSDTYNPPPTGASRTYGRRDMILLGGLVGVAAGLSAWL